MTDSAAARAVSEAVGGSEGAAGRLARELERGFSRHKGDTYMFDEPNFGTELTIVRFREGVEQRATFRGSLQKNKLFTSIKVDIEAGDAIEQRVPSGKTLRFKVIEVHHQIPPDNMSMRALSHIEADIRQEASLRTPGMVAPPVVTNNFSGPVFYGDTGSAQLAWGNTGDVTQTQKNSHWEEVAPGFEAIAASVAEVLRGLPSAALDDDIQADAEQCADDVLNEVVKSDPDRSVIRRAVSALQGFLLKAAGGMADGAVEGSQEWAQQAIASLNAPF